jgi:hypothetical protein
VAMKALWRRQWVEAGNQQREHQPQALQGRLRDRFPMRSTPTRPSGLLARGPNAEASPLCSRG